MQTESNESAELRGALRELVALSTIPAAWVGREPPIIAAGLADALVGSLQLDFAFVRLCDPKGGAAIEVTRGHAWKAFPEWLRSHLGRFGQFSCKEIVADLGGAESCRGVVIPIGVNAEAGLVAAASTRTDFPSEIDQLLLSVAANHAAAAFQNARLRHELDAKVAELDQARNELEMKVSERTADLQRSEAYLSEAQRLSHCGSFAWNVYREGIYWSEETYRIFECDPANEPTLEFILERTHPEDRALVQQLSYHAQQEGRHLHFEHRLLMPNGSVKHIEIVAHVVERHESDKFGYVGAVLDVTERKRAEALRDGESRILEMIARDAPLEEILEKLVRVVEVQFAGLLCSVLLLDEDGQHVRHGAAPSLPKTYTKAIDGLCIGPKAGSCGTAMYRREPVVVTDILEDPLWEPYRSVAAPYGFRACWSTPILAPSGKALGSFAMYYHEPRSPSLAETHALEMATHLAGIAIERKLAREERERLRQAQADLAHINRVTTMGELTASLAHEIKQPIAAAVTNAKTCLRWLGRDVPDLTEACEAASRMVKDVTRAADIIGRISVPFKKGAPQRELVDVNELIREMIVLLRSEANRYSISIGTELAEHLPKVTADRVQLQQVFMNLMLNGIDAMKDTSGGGELTIKSQAGDGQLLISVSDTGVGLPSEQADQIFRAFFTTKNNGTGMGLPISRSIIESHGGRLWVADSFGRGATFQFTLPATLAAHA
jgi:signal transduction histidine kinase/PAS domain-containing protein